MQYEMQTTWKAVLKLGKDREIFKGQLFTRPSKPAGNRFYVRKVQPDSTAAQI
ncbi:MAG TPA: hypothetical protein PLH68_03150 [Anaerolineaceae bacterium]|jgi:hypothetical protein|nr:hypothetical protein [Anaerolineaceae bacterium]